MDKAPLFSFWHPICVQHAVIVAVYDAFTDKVKSFLCKYEVIAIG